MATVLMIITGCHTHWRNIIGSCTGSAGWHSFVDNTVFTGKICLPNVLSSERRDGVSCDAYGLPAEQNCDIPWSRLGSDGAIPHRRAVLFCQLMSNNNAPKLAG